MHDDDNKPRVLVEGGQLHQRLKLALAIIFGLLIGGGAGLVFDTLQATEAGRNAHDAVAKVGVLAEANATRLQQQAAGIKVGLDILCKFKKYDLMTGLPALKARRERGGPEYDPARAQILERGLLLVLSIPSSPDCLASAASSPHIKKAGRPLLRELESGRLVVPPASVPQSVAPRIEREGTRHGAQGPRGPRGPVAPSTPTHTTTIVTTPAPAPSTAAPSEPPRTTPTVPTVPKEPPAVTTPQPPVKPPIPTPEPPVRQRPRLCIELVVLRVGC